MRTRNITLFLIASWLAVTAVTSGSARTGGQAWSTFTSTEGRFSVDYSDIPHFARHFAGPDTIYSHAKGALLLKTYGVETAYTDVTVSGEKGKRLVYDTPKSENQPKMRGDAVLVLVGTRLYVIDAVVPETEADARSQRFLSSVEVQE